MRKPFSLLASAAILAATAGCLVSMPKTNPLPKWDNSLLVSTEGLARRLNDPRTVIIHVGRDRASYDAGHIPGARFLPLSSIVTEQGGVPNELPPVEQLESTFEALGVSDNSRVVLYGDLAGLAAARAFFTLDYLGKTDAALLDGGLERWRSENNPVSTEAPSVRPGALTVRARRDIVVNADWVRERLGNDSTIVLIDARPPAEFTGDTPGEGITRPGHIPGAHNIFWRTALVSDQDLRLRSPEVLHAPFTLADAALGDTIVAYCRTGVQASHIYYQARYLRRPVVMYDGSFIDWSRRGEEYPVERGTGEGGQ
ncbi:MAG TPA: sulfurtransferase [Longimicrobium sp.]|jgi:thiosulfate/3-mercaptopyruvate sulfurtransferase|uniref:sulfurtransferase n=1 Tax=Longimicrobium sp. TaxID=2029185 RepID=UPI002ED84434